MKSFSFLFLSLVFVMLNGCSFSNPPEESKVNMDSNSLNAAVNPLPMLEEEENELPPLPETPMEPINVQTLPFFQEDFTSEVSNPMLMQAQSAKSAAECEKFQGNLKDICYRTVGSSPNPNVSDVEQPN